MGIEPVIINHKLQSKPKPTNTISENQIPIHFKEYPIQNPQLLTKLSNLAARNLELALNVLLTHKAIVQSNLQWSCWWGISDFDFQAEKESKSSGGPSLGVSTGIFFLIFSGLGFFGLYLF